MVGLLKIVLDDEGWPVDAEVMALGGGDLRERFGSAGPREVDLVEACGIDLS